MIYIGIKEDSANDFTYRPTPTGSQRLPGKMIKDYEHFESLIHEAVLKGQASEDDSKGHAYITYPPAKSIQDRFIYIANHQLPLLRDVLRNSSNAEHRSVAAWIIPYYANKRNIVPDLLAAVHDENETVRNNVTRALSILASYAAENTKAGITIPWHDFVTMIRSLVWTDRNKGLAVLVGLSKKRDLFLLKALKEQALDDLAEMAKWKNTGHAFFAFILLGRMAGIAEEDIYSNLELDTAARIAVVGKWINAINAN